MIDKALLPAGLRDVLPPDAAFEAAVEARLLELFALNGYERVDPPLAEFETSFLADEGAAIAADTFRIMDPISQHMLALRSDMTLQVARIARTRLAGEPRPLRLAYAGQVLRVGVSQLHTERQVAQAGVELIGAEDVSADVEVARLAFEALEALGTSGVSIDLGVPALVRALLADAGLEEDTVLGDALGRKDVAAVAERGGPRFSALMAATGPYDMAAPVLATLDLPPEATALRDRLLEVAAAVSAAATELRITIDPVEHRGFQYYSGVAFSLFVSGNRGEVGRGGRYRAEGETGTGVTFYLDAIHRLLRPPAPRSRLFLPYGADGAERRRWQADGWITLQALAPTSDPAAEARRLGCGYLLGARGLEALDGDSE
ncbi:MAG: ATP phosphoribosyltransferase regulatory subunit [Alphaproteobacteria bacterium]|nr:ATP phosphoribosyltransferase regulatory subunit [Alphaproteobacteria bacterium]MCY4320180.1 ATP phosphoribosyltransferase regulatory subunit [Alphaproteobacteria bacterium]